MKPLRVVAAAICSNGKVYSLPPPARHHNVLRYMAKLGAMPKNCCGTQGFLLNDGRFCTRPSAKKIAKKAGQLLPRAMNLKDLYSEDVW